MPSFGASLFIRIQKVGVGDAGHPRASGGDGCIDLEGGWGVSWILCLCCVTSEYVVKTAGIKQFEFFFPDHMLT